MKATHEVLSVGGGISHGRDQAKKLELQNENTWTRPKDFQDGS